MVVVVWRGGDKEIGVDLWRVSQRRKEVAQGGSVTRHLSGEGRRSSTWTTVQHRAVYAASLFRNFNFGFQFWDSIFIFLFGMTCSRLRL